MVDDRAKALIAPLVRQIEERVAPHAVILAGSYGRGEGIVRERNGRITLVNDVDLVVVFERAPTVIQRRQLRELAESQASSLGVRHIDLIPVTSEALKDPEVPMLHLDLKCGGAVLSGNTAVLDMIPCETGACPSAREVLNLLVNRMVSLFEAHPAFSISLSGPERARQLSKVFFALVDGWASKRGMYRTLYREKIASLQASPPENGDTLRDALLRACEWALPAWRMETTEEYAEQIVNEQWEYIVELLRNSILQWTEAVSSCSVKTVHECCEHWRGGEGKPSTIPRFLNLLRGRRHKFEVERDMFCLLANPAHPSRERLLHHIREWYRSWQ